VGSRFFTSFRMTRCGDVGGVGVVGEGVWTNRSARRGAALRKNAYAIANQEYATDISKANEDIRPPARNSWAIGKGV